MKQIFFLLALILTPVPLYSAPSNVPYSQPYKASIFDIPDPIRKTQELLKSQGFYKGVIDGVHGTDLMKAIEEYQKRYNLKSDGEITQELIEHIENKIRVEELIRRLENVRIDNKKKARDALLSNPKTKDLVLNKPVLEKPDPSRDFASCLTQPTPACLINEAIESSKSLSVNERRDWALGDILVAQVSVDSTEHALETTARIQDSRLILAALSNISKTLIKEKRFEEAFETLDLIPDVGRQIQVDLAYIEILIKEDLVNPVRHHINKVFQKADQIDEPVRRLEYRIQISRLLGDVDPSQALQELENIKDQIERTLNNDQKMALLRQNATAIAEIGYPEWSLKILDMLTDDQSRTPVLMAASRAFIEEKRYQAAIQTLERISSERYRSVILAELAFSLFKHNEIFLAEEKLEEALLLANNVELPFARNFALAKIAEIYMQIADVAKNKEYAQKSFRLWQKVNDERMRANGLWQLAVMDQKNALKTTKNPLFTLAETAFDEIPSKFSRAWLLADIVEQHLNDNEPHLARRSFSLGIRSLKEVRNSWAKSRVMAKYAILAHRLD